MNNIHIGILTPATLASREEGRAYLEALLEATPEWTPSHYNKFEPVNRPFDPAKLDDALDTWQWNFLFRRSKPTVRGSVWCGSRGDRASSYISVNKRAFNAESALRFVRALQQRFPIDLAYIYVPHPNDFAEHVSYNARIHPILIGISSIRLEERGLSTVPWAMLFGPSYLARIGREHLLRTPAARVEEMAGGVYVQLTETVAEVSTRRHVYVAAHHAVRDHLNSHVTGTPVFEVHGDEQQGSTHVD